MIPVKNIIFDLGGVLLNLDIQRSREAFIKLGIPQIDDLFRIGHAESFFKQYETGHLNDDQFITAVLQEAITGTTEEDILTAWNSMLLDFPSERVELLGKLKSKYRLFLFSNTNALHLQSFQKSFRDIY